MDSKQQAFEQTPEFQEHAKKLLDHLTIPAVNADKKITIEITGDLTDARILVQELVVALRGPDNRGGSRAASLAITKLEEAAFWLGEAAFGGK